MRWNDDLVALKNELVKLYPTKDDSYPVVRDAGLSSDSIAFKDKAVNNWSEIIDAALHQEKVVHIVHVALRDFPDNEILQRAELALSHAPTQSQAPSSPDHKNRAIMLRKLAFTYRELRRQSLQKAAWLKLDFADKPDAVQNTVALLLRQRSQPERLLPPGTSIVKVYEEPSKALLILGEPGSGKSTQLYALALHLVEQAANDLARPLPIVFLLSSWATNKLPLQEWMSEQLTQVYQVPKKLASQWVQERQIVPLLDGLDEVDEAARRDCIQAINNYYHAHLLPPLVVCSRSTEYAAAATSEALALQRAVVVQPLAANQVEATLLKGREALAALRAAYKKNVGLQELATTPLMLNLLILTYQGVEMHDLPTKGDLLQQQVFERYVQRMIETKGSYPRQQTYAWLHWLAKQMVSQQQTAFTLEQLQPSWLPQQVRSRYDRNMRIIGRLFFGLIGALLVGLIGIPIGMAIGVLTDRSSGVFVGGVTGTVLGGLLLGLVGGLLFGQGDTIKLAEKLAWSWKEARRGFIVGLPVGLVGGPFGALVGELLSGPHGGLAGGLLGGLFVGFSIFQLNDRLQLSQQEEYRHSMRKGLLMGLLVGLFAGLLVGLLEGLLMGVGSGEGLFVGLIGGLAGGLVGGLLFGFSTSQRNDRLRLSPSQEYRQSLRSRLLSGLLVGLLFGLVVELFVMLLFNLAGGLTGGLLFGLVGGMAGGIFGGLISGLSTSQQLDDRARVSPYEGYQRSKNYALAGGLLVGLLFGLAFGLVGGLLFGLVGGLLFGLVGGLAGGFTTAALVFDEKEPREHICSCFCVTASTIGNVQRLALNEQS